MPETDIKEALTTKIGPLPAIAWGGILGGTYVIWKYYQASRGGVSANDAGISTAGDVGTADDFTQGFSNTSPGLGAQGGSTVNGVNTNPAPTDNLQWGKRAIDWLISQGVAPDDAFLTINSFLHGTSDSVLNATQSAALRNALRQFGSPPEVVVIQPGFTQPPPTQPPPKPATPTPKVYKPAPAGLKQYYLPNKTADHTLETEYGWIRPVDYVNLANFFNGLIAAKSNAALAQNLANFFHMNIEGPGGVIYHPK